MIVQLHFHEISAIIYTDYQSFKKIQKYVKNDWLGNILAFLSVKLTIFQLQSIYLKKD